MANYILQVNYEKLTFSTLQVELLLIFWGGRNVVSDFFCTFAAI